MTHKLRLDLADEVNTITLTLQGLRRTDPPIPEALLPHLARLERATTRLWATIYAQPIDEVT